MWEQPSNFPSKNPLFTSKTGGVVDKGDRCRWNLDGIVRSCACSPEKNTPEITTSAARCWCHRGTGWTRSNNKKRRKCCKKKTPVAVIWTVPPFLHWQTRWERRTPADGPESGYAHGWGLWAAQLPHKWIFTSFWFLFSFLPNQVIRDKISVIIAKCHFFFCCALTFLRTNVIYSFHILTADIFRHNVSGLS